MTSNTIADQPKPVIRLDRSRDYSTVHGDRTPLDPHYRVHFWQGGLPFDVSETLIHDDGKREVFSEDIDEGEGVIKKVRYRPLYDDERAALYAKRIERARRNMKEPLPEEKKHEDPAEDVNFASWLRGEARYEPNDLFKAWFDRYHRKHRILREIVTDAVLDEKLVPLEQISPDLAALLPSNIDPSVPSRA